jgi:FG-GAP-like repeat
VGYSETAQATAGRKANLTESCSPKFNLSAVPVLVSGQKLFQGAPMFSLSAVRSFLLFFLKSFGFVVAIVAAMALSASAQATFERQDVNVGTRPSSIVSADFNRDGIPDLAVTLSGSNAVAVLLGKGDGKFASPATYATGPNPLQLIAADFNHDGAVDLAVFNQGDATISVLLGNGDGTLRPKVNIGNGSSIIAGDFNRDGFDDIAAITGTTTISIYLSNGNGSFRRLDFSAGENRLTALAAGDFNHDGIPDLVVTDCCHNPDVALENNYLLAGNGDGTFRPEALAFTTSGLIDLEAADLDQNGVPDLMVGFAGCHTPCHGMQTELSKGDGTFSRGPAINLETLQYAGPFSTRAADFDGDGNSDVAAINLKNDAQFGGGADHSVVSIFLLAGGKVQTQLDFVTGNGAQGLAIADFNRDGRPDAATANNADGTVSVLLNTTGITTAPAPQSDFSVSNATGSVRVNRGQPATFTLTIAPVNGAFNSPVSLSCSGLPAGTSCSFNPNAVTPGNESGTSLLTINTGVQTASKVRSNALYGLWVAMQFLPAGVVLAAGVRNRGRGKRLLAVLAMAICLFAVIGCGSNVRVSGAIAPPQTNGNSPGGSVPASGGGSSSPSTAPTTHNIVVTGTSGPLQHSVSLSLTIQ